MNDSETTVKELKGIIRKFCDDRDWSQFHNAKDLAIGVSTEAGELLDLFRFKNEQQVESIMYGEKRKQVSDELADVVYFALRLADMYNIDISEELERKISENEIKYPIEKAKGCNEKYKDFN